MTQMTPPQAVSLFDLIGRSWMLDEKVESLTFNADESTLLARHSGGRLTFIVVADAEAPEKRMRAELETGRMTIRPRENPLPTPKRSVAGMAQGDVCTLGQSGFAFVHAKNGEIWKATAGGQTLRLAPKDGPKATALAELPKHNALVIADEAHVSLMASDGSKILSSQTAEHRVKALSVSPDGTQVACWGEGRISVLTATDELAIAFSVDVGSKADLSGFSWSPDGKWLVAGSAEPAIVLVDLTAQTADRIVDFPATVRTIAFNGPSKTMIASGAFRVVGWTLPDLPFGDHEGKAIETGKAGLTIVEAVASHPSKNLCSAGYANGLVTICQIGSKEEMMLREGAAPVTSLAWSSDGAHLAIGTEDGVVALATIPKSMFK